MATYIILNVSFFLASGALLALLQGALWRPTKAIYGTLAVVLVLTAIFDSVLVGLGIVAYDEGLISGIYIGNAPVEDFFYALLAVVLVPAIWDKLEERNARKN